MKRVGRVAIHRVGRVERKDPEREGPGREIRRALPPTLPSSSCSASASESGSEVEVEVEVEEEQRWPRDWQRVIGKSPG